MVQLNQQKLKPPPLIVTLVPIGPELGVRVIVGVGTVTVNVVVGEVTCGALNLHSIGARRGRRGYYETGTTQFPTD